MNNKPARSYSRASKKKVNATDNEIAVARVTEESKA